MANGDSMEDVWLVQLPGGAVRAWSLDQLDAEFQKGTIDERTLVRQGTAPWSTLGKLLGLEEQVPSSLAPYQIQSAAPPPVVMSVDDDLDVYPPRRSRKGLVLGLMAAALVVCGGVFAFNKVGGVTRAPASTARQIANVAAPPPPAPVPPPAATQLDMPKGAPLTDLQKKALLDADKNRERASKEAKEKRAKLAPPRRAPKSASPFHKGGNKSDPLNSAL